METAEFDVVIVGAGVAGALMARQLTESGLKVLLLEAGPGTPQTQEGYDQHLRTFYEASAKSPGAPWPASPYAPQPDTTELRFSNGYFVQNGPDLYGSSYTRTQGGSTLHFLGVSLRMLPEDFQLKSRYGVGRDWPLSYDSLEPFYRKAEEALGVSADVADQSYHGIRFADGYDFPMHKIPLSYSDQWLGEALKDFQVCLGDEAYSVKIRSYPAARNSMPRASYRPVGATERALNGRGAPLPLGERCQGNTSCTPICPVQAKYQAGRTLALLDPSRIRLLSRAVASRLHVDPLTGMIQGLTYHRYDDTGQTSALARGRYYVLAAHAVENARLLLASGLAGSSGQVGRNLMDHPTLYAWGLAPQPLGPFRGPLSTAGVEDLRGGRFRAHHAAFRFDVGNDGWAAPVGSPEADVRALVQQGTIGATLRQSLAATLPRQVRLSLAVEQLPDPENRVTLDTRFRDALGLPRPAISYRISEYTLAGMVEAKKTAAALFQHAGIEDRSDRGPQKWFPAVQYNGATFYYHGMGHFAGTHLMGSSAQSSVVDHTQRTWDHPNLYLVGSGSFPTMGTSNPTLTLAALAIRTADHLVQTLKNS